MSYLGAIGLIIVLAYKDHAGEAVTALGLLLGATWGGYTANSVARVATSTREVPLGPRLTPPDDLALEPKTAAFILVDGRKHGRFTGKKLSDYIDQDGYDFYNARRIVNGTDRAEHIENLAINWLKELGYEPA